MSGAEVVSGQQESIEGSDHEMTLSAAQETELAIGDQRDTFGFALTGYEDIEGTDHGFIRAID